MQPQSKLIAKDSQEHERYFRAFLENQVVSWTVEDLFGTVHVLQARVFGVEHASDKTRFTLQNLFRGASGADADKLQPRDTR